MTPQSQRRTILLTRPIDQSLEFADEIKDLGTIVIEPVLTIETTTEALPDLVFYQGLVFTSANAVKAFSSLFTDTDPYNGLVFAVGNQTTNALRALGLDNIHNAAGSVDDLMVLIESVIDDADLPLLYLSGDVITRDIISEAIQIDRHVMYSAQPVTQLSDDFDPAEIDIVCFFSSRSAACFCDLVAKAGYQDDFKQIDAVCMSEATAKSLHTLQWKTVRVAETPDRAAMIKALK